MQNPTELLTTGDTARLLNVSVEYTRALADSGRLTCQRDSSGRRLFDRGEAERVAAERARRASARG